MYWTGFTGEKQRRLKGLCGTHLTLPISVPIKQKTQLNEVRGTHLLAELLDGASSLNEVLKEAMLPL